MLITTDPKLIHSCPYDPVCETFYLVTYCGKHFLLSFFLQTLMSVFLIRYLLNILILLITAMLMQTARTLKDHSTARVTRDTLEMEIRVLVK